MERLWRQGFTCKPPISYLMYADDLVIYCRVEEDEATKVLNCLQRFYQYTGQDINFNKSAIHFSRNIEAERKQRILRSLKMTKCDHKFFYLSLHFYKTQMKLTFLSSITDKVKSRLARGKGRTLSFVGRGVLVNSVAQTIPSYAMQTYLLPNLLCNKLDAFDQGFFVGKTGPASTQIVFKSVEQHLCSQRSWDDKLWVKVLKSKYLRGLNFFDEIPILKSSSSL